MTKLNPEKWKNAFKWQFEAYPIFTSGYVNAAQIKEKNKYYTDWADFLNKFEGGHLVAFKPSKHILRIGNAAIKESLIGRSGYHGEIKKIQNEMEKAIMLCLRAREEKLTSLNGWWPQTQKALSHAANILFSFDYAFDVFLREFEAKNQRDFEALKEHIENKKLSFMNEAGVKLLELNKRYGKNFNKVFNDFDKEFGWFQNSYKGAFKIEKKWLKNYLKEVKNKINKPRSVKRNNKILPKRYKAIIELTNDIIIFRDDKKKLLLLSVDLIEAWLKDLCQNNNWKYDVMRWLTIDEILWIIKDERNVFLKAAKKYSNENKRLGIMTHTGYENITERFWNSTLKFHAVEHGVKEIRGIVANKGICRGTTKIMLNAKNEASKFNNGDILVTSMTRPEFLPLMSRAKAFITDEGGISCHAAIVAREMGKPCIIATKNATIILKDGDLVEVDADKGIVKIIKKA